MSVARCVLVVGASLGGLAVANTLSRTGVEVQIFAGHGLRRGLVLAAEVTREDEFVTRFHLATDPSHHFVAYPMPTPDDDVGATEHADLPEPFAMNGNISSSFAI